MLAKTYAALVAVSLSVGYLVGAQWSQRHSSRAASSYVPIAQSSTAGDERDADVDSSEDEQPLEELGTVSAGLVEECKLVSVISPSIGNEVLISNDFFRTNGAVGARREN